MHNPTQQPTTAGGMRDDIVVFITRHGGHCAECAADFFDGSWIRLEGDRPLCLACADLDHLEYLPRGDAALTRRASKYSALRAVVVQWSRTRQRYERQGVLVVPAAIRRAEEECLADADLRARRRQQAATQRERVEARHLADVTGVLHARFPGCPADEAAAIARWTCEKHSGRVGRSAAGKALAPAALRLAVIAHIRHEHTNYDALLMRHGDRLGARRQVASAIEAVLARWESTSPSTHG